MVWSSFCLFGFNCVSCWNRMFFILFFYYGICFTGTCRNAMLILCFSVVDGGLFRVWVCDGLFVFFDLIQLLDFVIVSFVFSFVCFYIETVFNATCIVMLYLFHILVDCFVFCLIIDSEMVLSSIRSIALFTPIVSHRLK